MNGAACHGRIIAAASRLAFFRITTRGLLQRQLQTPLCALRCFSSFHRRKWKKGQNPFKILGIRQDDPYTKCKSAFLKIAMENHPDTAAANATEEERNQMKEQFIRARVAFESLVEGPENTILLEEEAEEMEGFDEWFKSETGHNNPFDLDMDPETMKEVAKMTDTLGDGLDRDGGMWTLAKMVSNAVKQGNDSAQMLRLEAGEVRRPDDRIDGVIRRRRRPR